jgi:hypothetical protein
VSTDNLAAHKVEYNLTVAKLNEFADKVRDPSVSITDKFTSQDAMLGQIKNWATVSGTNQRDIKHMHMRQQLEWSYHNDWAMKR